jgi:serine/threonine protein kinase
MIGTKLAHYEITSHIGSGGMGDVYQATDTKLSRSVAIKFLPEAFSHDTERVARFQREARVLASLNHSNIAGIHGLEEIDSRHFLVMELVPGETLADRIKRGAIPIEEALPIAKQIAEALAEAHDRGVIHRDLKPANIKVTPDGKVKVLDFGLAKAFETETGDTNLSQSPTLSMAATNAGLILGTASYMSPEQAKGRQVDRRTDIFAFGAVLYEMLTARPAFEGDDIQEILSAVIRAEPEWNRLPPSVPGRIMELLKLCLRKNAKERRQTATDVRIDIEQAFREPERVSAAPLPAVRPCACGVDGCCCDCRNSRCNGTSGDAPSAAKLQLLSLSCALQRRWDRESNWAHAIPLV